MAHYVDDLEDEDLLEADEIELLNGEENAEAPPGDNEDTNEQTEPIPAEPEPAKKRVSTKPRAPIPKLNPERLLGPRGLIILREWFRDTSFKGKGHEKEDLDTLMCRLEQWTHRLFPKFTFDDSLSRIEKLGHKSQVANYVKRIRLDMVDEVTAIDADREIVDDDDDDNNEATSNVDPFDALLNRNIQAPRVQSVTLTDEQRETMLRNRLLAEERRMARMQVRTSQINKESDLQINVERSNVTEPENAEVATSPLHEENTLPVLNNDILVDSI